MCGSRHVVYGRGELCSVEARCVRYVCALLCEVCYVCALCEVRFVRNFLELSVVMTTETQRAFLQLYEENWPMYRRAVESMKTSNFRNFFLDFQW